MDLVTAVTRRETQDWELFVDWCLSMDTTPLPTTVDAISEFLAAFQAPIETQGRRVRAIRKAHSRAGQWLDLPTTRTPSALRQGETWAPVARALAQVPKYEHPKNFHAALRGRRDGWLIVLVGVLGLSRNEARTLHESDVQVFPDVTIKDVPVLKNGATSASECPACAVTRWLRIAGAASLGYRSELHRLVSPIGADCSAHDCATNPGEAWREATTLLPSIDRHGWVSPGPMSARSVSATMAYLQVFGSVPEIRTPLAPTVGRFADATMNEVADAYDDIDQQAAAILLRMKEILGDSTEMLSHLNAFDL